MLLSSAQQLSPFGVTVRPNQASTGHARRAPASAFKTAADTQPHPSSGPAVVGLPFAASCLKSHRSDRVVRTASAAQVRQPMRSDTARAECTPLHKGRSTMVWQTRITRADGRLCAVVTQTQMVLKGKT